jgi:hypothetical protein
MYAFGSGSGDAYRPGTPPASSSAASTSGSSGVASRFSIASFTSSSSSSSSSADRFNSPSSSTSSSGFPNVLKRASSSVYPSSLSAGGATAVQLPPSINILDRNLAKTRGGEVANAAWAFLFSEMVQYTQRRVAGIAEFEQRCVRACVRADCTSADDGERTGLRRSIQTLSGMRACCPLADSRK